MNLEELLARLESIGELSPDELSEIETQLRQAYRDIRGGELNEDVIALLSRITEAVDSITMENATRLVAQAELDRQAAELDSRLETEPVVEDEEPAAEAETEEPAVEAVAEAPADEAPVETEAVVEPELEAVAAAAARPAPRPISELARRTPIRTQPRAQSSMAHVTATPNVPNMRGGQEITDRAEMSQAMADVWNANRGADGNGVNGITHEVLLEIVADRLRSFQKGPYSCKANACALTHIEEAQHWLQQRTIERMRRGVEGTHTV